MKTNKLTKLAILALAGLVAFGTIAQAADEAKPANPPAEKKSEAAKPTPADIAKLEEEVGLSAEQKSKSLFEKCSRRGKEADWHDENG